MKTPIAALTLLTLATTAPVAHAQYGGSYINPTPGGGYIQNDPGSTTYYNSVPGGGYTVNRYETPSYDYAPPSQQEWSTTPQHCYVGSSSC